MTTDKPAIYLVPGTACSERLWRPLEDRLPEYQLVHVPIPDGDNIATKAKQLLSILPEHAVNLLGFSLGGYLAAYLVSHFPERFNAVFIVANTPKTLPASELASREQTLNWLQRFNYNGMPEQKMRQLLAPENWQNQRLKQSLLTMEEEIGQAELIQQLRSTTEREDLAEGLLAVSQKVWMCYGEEDPLIDLSWFEQQYSLLTRCSQVKGSKHMIPLEQPDWLADWIKQKRLK